MMLKTKAAARRNRKSSEEEFLDACEIEEEGFIDGDVHLGKVLSTFNFGMNSAAESKDSPNEHSFHPKSSEAPVQPDCNKTSVQVNCSEAFNRTKGHDSSLHTQGNTLFSSQTESLASAPHGLTPPINGENFTVKRSYAMRPSTVRKLNALKAEHPDVNVLFNTLVDMAITHYYNYIINENGSFQGLGEN